MRVLSKEKVKVLADKNGWTIARAEGFVEGESYRRRGKMPSAYFQVGIDDYSLGFRAGFYERGTDIRAMSSVADLQALPVARLQGQRNAEAGELQEAGTLSASGR